MQEVRLVELDEPGRALVLEVVTGSPTDASRPVRERLTLPVDDRLHAALRRDKARTGQLEMPMDSALTPRDIQARIRAGATAEEVSAAAGVAVERIRRYEGPILAERAHVAEVAAATGVRRATDGRFPALGELVTERLAHRGVDGKTVEWDAVRREDGRWSVLLRYVDGARTHAARWVFDPRGRLLTPDDEAAQWLSAEDFDGAAPPDRGTRRLAAVPAPADDADLGATPEPLAPLPATPTTPPSVASPPAAPAGAARPALPATAAADEAAPAQPGRHAARAGRRPSVPSWDEIVLGSRPRG